MIDTSKCEYEEASRTDAESVYYFTYPKELSPCVFHPGDEDEDCGEMVAACIAMLVPKDGEPSLQIAATVEYGDGYLDVDWHDLIFGVDYTDETVDILLGKTLGLETEMQIPLHGDAADWVYDSICDYVSEYLSDQTGFCHKRFSLDIQIKATNIVWDTEGAS